MSEYPDVLICPECGGRRLRSDATGDLAAFCAHCGAKFKKDESVG